jgi:2-polyprenyl-6-methoxyphenol hydroxylase-like FAD-dependent oxidoreductase
MSKSHTTYTCNTSKFNIPCSIFDIQHPPQYLNDFLTKNNNQMKNITIIGGGIAGLTTAIALKKIGIETTIFEAAPEIKPVGAGLGLGANALKAFDYLGIADEVMKAGRLLDAFTVYDQAGKPITRTDSKAISAKYGADNFAIHRADLHRILMSKIDAGSITTNQRAVDFEQKENSVIIKFQSGMTYETDYLIVADGIHSPIRQKLLPNSKPRYAGYTCWRGVTDNSDLNLTEASETWGAAGRIGILPMANNKIYWFACVNAPQNDPTMKAYTIADVQRVYKNFHAPIPQVLAQTKQEQVFWNDIIDLEPISQYAFKNIVLIGDAAHATTPNLGQGGCQAIEDAVVLADEIKAKGNIVAAFKAFESRRMKRTHYVVNTSWTVGKVAQWQNALLIALRNAAFRLIPPSVNEQQLSKLYNVDFGKA